MGQSGSKDHRLYLQILKTTLRERGRAVTTQQLEDFLAHVQDTCSLVPRRDILILRSGNKLEDSLERGRHSKNWRRLREKYFHFGK